jgi:hypothetical protein
MIHTVRSSNEAQVEHEPSPADRLAAEAARYLEAVELFRSEGCEPRHSTTSRGSRPSRPRKEQP